jgi:hypothetical protein
MQAYRVTDKPSVPQNWLSLSFGERHCLRSVGVRSPAFTPATCWYFSACFPGEKSVTTAMLEGEAAVLIRGMSGSPRESPLTEVCRRPSPFGWNDFTAIPGPMAHLVRGGGMISPRTRLLRGRHLLGYPRLESPPGQPTLCRCRNAVNLQFSTEWPGSAHRAAFKIAGQRCSRSYACSSMSCSESDGSRETESANKL